MATLSTVMLAASGLALDMGRLFIAKQETQTYVDSGALAAALELDGTTDGITRARTAATSSGNTWNMNTATPSGALVDFGTTADGPWVSNPNPATNYNFARVRLTVAANLYFLPLVANQYTQNVISSAVGGKVNLTTVRHGLSPYTAIAQDPASKPNFGLTLGEEYTIQWPAMRPASELAAFCRENNPANCFVKRPCGGDSNAVMWSVRNNWGADTNGYWGFSNSSELAAAILDGKQTVPIYEGMNLDPVLTNGNMASQGGVLDDRAQQDHYNGSNDVDAYLDHADQNGRRLIAVPIVEIVSPTETIVRGFGQFLLYSNGNSSNYYERNVNGNDPFCGIYAGTYTIGSNNPGGPVNGGGAYHISLVK